MIDKGMCRNALVSVEGRQKRMVSCQFSARGAPDG